MIEIERTFLAKSMPDLTGCRSIEIIDMYIPKQAKHPILRIRKNGNRYEMTKKNPVSNDASVQKEQTIILTKEEFESLIKSEGKTIHKIRYFYNHEGYIAEIDIFQGDLTGLVLIDFEFQTEEEKNAFNIPGFCLADVTQEDFIAGGMLCGKRYEDIEQNLKRFDYHKINYI